MKYEFMHEHRNEFHVARMAKVLEVSESGYYKWEARLQGGPTPLEKAEMRLGYVILDIFQRSRGSFGSRKVTAELHKRGIPVNHKRVERIMSKYGVFSRTSRKYIHTTDSSDSESIAENLIKRDFTAEEKDRKMVSDTTAIATKEGTLYIAGIIDLYGRMPVGLAMSTRNDRWLTIQALKDMLLRGCGKKGCIMHSDRGCTYASQDYREMLEKHDLVCSMSGKGDCWDNAPMESFWGKMKTEWLKPKYGTMKEAMRDVYEYVWHFYPKERPHESLGYLTPVEVYDQLAVS